VKCPKCGAAFSFAAVPVPTVLEEATAQDLADLPEVLPVKKTRATERISFVCPFCDKPVSAPDGARGRWLPCPACAVSIRVPPNIITVEEYLARAAQPKAEPGPSACPCCQVPIDPRPKRSRKCKACGETFYVRLGTLFTAQKARAYDEQFGSPLKWMNRGEKIHYHRHYFACEFLSCKQNASLYIGVLIVATKASLCCLACRKHHKGFVSVATGKPEDLPPFPDCVNENSCPCGLLRVFRDRELNRFFDVGD
jgi:hypothetical protein